MKKKKQGEKKIKNPPTPPLLSILSLNLINFIYIHYTGKTFCDESPQLKIPHIESVKGLTVVN